MAWTLKQDSLTKCVAYFADGNARTFHSLDWRHKLSRYRDRELGLTRLRSLIQKWGPLSNTAIIYDNETGLELERYEQGIKI
ncbi:MAG TPA: hypothetical protein VLB84_17375 [Bacteroidia bacterium]|jgi:hypothetical protein|nr:hypothetical protein [Bacteroidia bacterium]